jgi:hypothetical protein
MTRSGARSCGFSSSLSSPSPTRTATCTRGLTAEGSGGSLAHRTRAASAWAPTSIATGTMVHGAARVPQQIPAVGYIVAARRCLNGRRLRLRNSSASLSARRQSASRRSTRPTLSVESTITRLAKCSSDLTHGLPPSRRVKSIC